MLDGHGESGKSFADSSMEKWINSLNKEINIYKEKYKNIVLVGHSMGATLSILSYIEHKEYIKGIISISAPIHVRVKVNIVLSSIKIALGNINENDMLTNHAYNAFSVDRCSILTYLRWIPRYIDLFKLIIRSRKLLDKIEVPVLVVNAMNDELVSHRSLNVFEKKLNTNKKIINLQKSGHFYYDEVDIEYLYDEYKIFLDELAKYKIV